MVNAVACLWVPMQAFAPRLSVNGGAWASGKGRLAMRTMTTLAILLAAVAAAPASAAWQGSDWPIVAQSDDNGCALEISGNGRIFLIEAQGLGAGSVARLQLTNGDMTPIDWTVRAGADGRIARYHMPFRFNRAGGVVGVSIDARQCALSASFGWQRGIRVID